MKLGITKKVYVDAKTLKIHIKIRDEFSACLQDQDGEEIFCQEDGYVPSLMPGEHFGDYIILDIDIDTGQVTNWKTPSEEDLMDWINQADVN